jgi:hypothetical protein
MKLIDFQQNWLQILDTYDRFCDNAVISQLKEDYK